MRRFVIPQVGRDADESTRSSKARISSAAPAVDKIEPSAAPGKTNRCETSRTGDGFTASCASARDAGRPHGKKHSHPYYSLSFRGYVCRGTFPRRAAPSAGGRDVRSPHERRRVLTDTANERLLAAVSGVGPPWGCSSGTVSGRGGWRPFWVAETTYGGV